MASAAESGFRAPSHNVKPGRRRDVGIGRFLMLSIVAVLALCSMSDALVIEQRAVAGLPRNLGAREPSRQGTLAAEIAARQDPLDGSSTTKSTEEPSSTSKSAPKTSSSPSSTDQASPTADGGGSLTYSSTSASLTALPKVFDSALGSNFTNSSCPLFLEGLSENSSFNDCLPLSTLLGNSESFFQDESNPDLLSQVLDSTCNVVFPTCQSLMNSLALQLKSPSNCGADYALGNPIVTLAYNSFIAYTPIYQAGCLKASASAEDSDSESDTSSDQYCFVSATLNTSGTGNSYVYSLPLGNAYPSGESATCSPCLKQTMAYFASAASNMSTPLSEVYNSAAKLIDAGCGASFANSSVQPNPSTKNAASIASFSIGSVMFLAVGLGFVMA